MIPFAGIRLVACVLILRPGVESWLPVAVSAGLIKSQGCNKIARRQIPEWEVEADANPLLTLEVSCIAEDRSLVPGEV